MTDTEVKEFEAEIKRLEDRISDKDDEIDDLQDEINDLESEVDELKKGFHLTGVHANNRTQTAMEELFDNLDYIPISEFENFINTHKKL